MSVVVWIGMVLMLLGIQNAVIAWMDSVSFGVGNAHMTLLSLITGLLWVAVTLIVAMWLGSSFEDRLMRTKTLDGNLKVVVARVGRAAFVLAAILISLSIVGIDITVLGVFGGALGVGLGFGMQKIASNYVSGFIILLDRSLRIGDTINVSGLQGRVTQIRTRYTVVRELDGIETLIPNEKLITDVVQNQSSYLTRGYARAAVQIAYTSDVEPAMTLLAQAAADVPRVLRELAPTPFLVGFGRDGINLGLGFWIEDAVSGTWRALNRQLQYLASLFRARHHYCAPATRGAHRRSGKRPNAAPGGDDRSDFRHHVRSRAQARQPCRQRRPLSPISRRGKACASAQAIAIDLIAHKKSLFVTNTWNRSSRISSYPAVCFHFHDTRAACASYLSFCR